MSRDASVAEPSATGPAAGPVPIVNIANVVTVLRLLLVPVFAVLLFARGGDEVAWRAGAWAAFAVASITDRIDGHLARSRGLVTPFGEIADPIADKALIGTALVGLSMLGELPWWVTVPVLVREVGVTALRFWVIRHGVIPASRGGKAKTMLQSFAIGLFVLVPNPGGGVAVALGGLMAVAVVVTMATGVDYVARALTLRQTSARAAMKRRRRAARET